MFILAQFQPSQLQGAWPFALGLGKKQYVMAEESCSFHSNWQRRGKEGPEVLIHPSNITFLRQRPTSVPTFFKLRAKPST